ncbi:MAG: restriction endonuclease [Synechococcus sp. SB0666_bin_14]|nr:restriction endonuclease [Synechococcus sp. SB0666_bin_14]MYA91474.1 restriction endonuclease [Synechococcus sp. SB0663_bin_10]MYG46287.1 restriction endonuclease [Synechococcus sp. SB0675_bin_6]MYJ59914.1 restriction endonuclease [Synechococcus sp. SB0672_bin_6]MYK91396.1 restriction endonuclease [Synechococcus sp. SB0669_bin_8]
MSLNLANYEAQAREAVKLFWRNREAALAKQIESGNQDAGLRGAVTAGKNMDGFLAIARSLVEANGLNQANICLQQRVLTLPEFFHPTKLWDMLVMNHGKLVAALEFKSQVGPSFGNNFNNRSEEAIGAAYDLWTAYREGAFGEDAPRPLLVWIMLLEDCDKSNSPVKDKEPHFPVDQAFKGASHAQRYDLLCRRLVQEGLYSSATLLVSPREAAEDGHYRHLSELTSLKSFVAHFAGHIAAVAARR